MTLFLSQQKHHAAPIEDDGTVLDGIDQLARTQQRHEVPSPAFVTESNEYG